MYNMVPFTVPVGNRDVAGDFHRPYEGRFPFIGVLGKREGLYCSSEIVSKWVKKVYEFIVAWEF